MRSSCVIHALVSPSDWQRKQRARGMKLWQTSNGIGLAIGRVLSTPFVLLPVPAESGGWRGERRARALSGVSR
eukprot:scaffold178334_cov31-Tisochrysis_lutea.AAC.4